MINGILPSETVALEYIDSFMELASPLLDIETMLSFNRSFDQLMIIDPRYPNAATRQHGLINTCSRCESGFFVDERTKQLVHTHDWRYQAARAFAFIGYALAQIGHECTGLWDPSEPVQIYYGPYESRPCLPLPPAQKHLITVPSP
jgi:hypothetical protein